MPLAITSAAFAASIISSASAAFDPSSKTNVVTYWGQGAYQKRLVETCKIAAVDVINIAFVNRFPDNSDNGYPGDNFGNACYGDTYQNSTGGDTQLLKTCPYIGQDVIACQQTYGKKIFLSLGGAYPTDYYIRSDASGRNFADFLWGAWGPVNSSWTGPRPWGNAVVDGFDFDIESNVTPVSRLTSGYTQMINRLKNTWFPLDKSKSYYISGAPQCVLPDVHFTNVLNRAWFDFIWVQFYNTAQCSARAGINNQNGSNKNQDISYTNWTMSSSLNPNVKYHLGLVAAPQAAYDSSYFLTLAEAQRTIQRFYGNSLFGGVMLYEATYAQNNTVCNKDQLTWHKDILNGQAAGKPATVTCPATSTSTTTSTRSSTTTYRSSTTTTSTANKAAVKVVSTSSSSSTRTTSTTIRTSTKTYTTLARRYGRSEPTAIGTRSLRAEAIPA